MFLLTGLIFWMESFTVFAEYDSVDRKTRPWLGVLTQTVLPLLAEALGLLNPNCVLVSDVQS